MKTLFLAALTFASFMISGEILTAQTPPTSAQVINDMLSNAENRNELTRLNSGITTILADQRLTDQAARLILSECQPVLIEMLNQKVGTNAGKLVDLAKWLRSQAEANHAIEDADGTRTPQQQFVLDNPLAGQEVYLTALLRWILTEYVQRDREAAGAAKLEGFLQLYLQFKSQVEASYCMPEDFLFFTPQWIQSRYPQLSADQKRRFLKDVNDARIEKALGPAADEEPGPQPTAQEQAAYNAAYQFIVNNTPHP